MVATRVVHTADLSEEERAEIRELLDRAFGDRFEDSDWGHALGGLHVLVTEAGSCRCRRRRSR